MNNHESMTHIAYTNSYDGYEEEGGIFIKPAPPRGIHIGVYAKDNGDADITLPVDKCKELIDALQRAVVAASVKNEG